MLAGTEPAAEFYENERVEASEVRDDVLSVIRHIHDLDVSASSLGALRCFVSKAGRTEIRAFLQALVVLATDDAHWGVGTEMLQSVSWPLSGRRQQVTRAVETLTRNAMAIRGQDPSRAVQTLASVANPLRLGSATEAATGEALEGARTLEQSGHISEGQLAEWFGASSGRKVTDT